MMSRNLFWVATALLSIVSACNYTDGECWRRDQGGIDGPGAGGSIVDPSGAGGGYGDTPPGGGTGANACNAAEKEEQPKPPDEGKMPPTDGGTELGDYIRCWGQGATVCSQRCFAIGAPCVEHAYHPNNPSVGIGDLHQCMSNLLSHTCSYCYVNGDVCTFLYPFGGIGIGACTNTGGKGCE